MKLLLDVDGVLCPFRNEIRAIHPKYRKERLDLYPGFIYHEDYYVFTSTENARRVKRLMNTFEIHWCTGWGNAANEVIAPLHGFPEFPTVPLEMHDISEHVHWKYNGIVPYVKDEPYAFVDDDIFEDGLEYARHRTANGIPTFWCKTDCDVGLTDDHVRQLEDFYAHANLVTN